MQSLKWMNQNFSYFHSWRNLATLFTQKPLTLAWSLLFYCLFTATAATYLILWGSNVSEQFSFANIILVLKYQFSSTETIVFYTRCEDYLKTYILLDYYLHWFCNNPKVEGFLITIKSSASLLIYIQIILQQPLEYIHRLNFWISELYVHNMVSFQESI